MANFHFSPRPNRAHEIHWHEWGDAAFAQAKDQDKPILLALSAVWCHWCHVMDETSYSDPAIIQAINERYVPIRVDNDMRPDVNRRYNLGGWPTTAFLTPDGDILSGGTYIPPSQMLLLVNQVADVYKSSKQSILDQVAKIHARRAVPNEPRATAKGELSMEIVEIVQKQVEENYDASYGGFGQEPKFPQTDVLEFLLATYYETRNESLLHMVTETLTQMARGGMYDHEAGGFFRYSTTRDWSTPHFEKMLEDNAKLLAVYSHAWQVEQKELFAETMHSTIEYVQSTLADLQHGGFYGSQDADERYYSLSLAERAQWPPPYVDHTFYTDWNALMVSAYLQAAMILSENHLQAFALETLDRIWTEMYHPDSGLYHYARAGGPPQLPDQLSDLGRTTAAFLLAYQATGDSIYLSRARILADRAFAQLFDKESGGFWSEPPAQDALGLLRVPDKSIDENADMASAFAALYRFTSDDSYRAAAEESLVAFVDGHAQFGFMAANYARAVDQFLNEPLEIRIVGGLDDERTRELHAAALKVYAPGKLVQLLDPVRDTERIAQFGYPADVTPLAYVCVGTRCLAPVNDPAALKEAMGQMSRLGQAA